jgi:hypothetical protein
MQQVLDIAERPLEPDVHHHATVPPHRLRQSRFKGNATAAVFGAVDYISLNGKGSTAKSAAA